MRIKGYAAKEAGTKLELADFDLGPLGPEEVDIDVSHCGICHSDIHLIDNDWKISRFPFVPGHEVVGTVRTVGPEVRGLKAGQRVGVGWQASSCMHCEWCVRGEETVCDGSVATCVGRHGGYADAVRADYRFAFPIPEGLESRHAAPLFCAGATVYTPLREWAHPEMRVGVIGIGGLGHLALQYAAAMGCEVTAFSSTAGKRAEAMELGAHHFVVSNASGPSSNCTAQIDLLLSTVTVGLDWAAWTKVLRPLGKLVLLGASPNRLEVVPFMLIGDKKSIHGSAIGTRTGIREMLQFSARHGIRPMIEVVPMGNVNEAISFVRKSGVRYRIVLER